MQLEFSVEVDVKQSSTIFVVVVCLFDCLF